MGDQEEKWEGERKGRGKVQGESEELKKRKGGGEEMGKK